MSAALIPIGMQLAGGVLSGYGNAKRNAADKARKQELDFRIGQLRGVTDPIQSSLVEGWEPGGFLRKQVEAQGRANAESAFGRDKTTARNNAWRFGGSNSGRFLGDVDRASDQRFLRMSQAGSDADLHSLDQLSRIFSSVEGVNNAFPVDLARNPYAGIAQGIQEFGAEIGAANVL